MFRYQLRTLLILIGVGPPILAGIWWFALMVLYFSCIFAVAFILFLLAIGSAVVIGRFVAR